MSRPHVNIQPRPEDTSVMVDTLCEFKRVSIYGWAVLFFTGLFMGGAWSWASALEWILQAGLLWILVLYEANRYLPLNRNSSESDPYPRLGLANRLTILRGWLIACTGGFLFQQSPSGGLAFVPAGFYAVSAIIDRIDGYAARKTGQVSQMGMELDTIFDALGLAIAPLLAVWYGKIHWSYLLVSCAYYLFKWGLRYRRKNGLPVYVLKPKLSRRAIAGFQMGFIAGVLFPVFQPPATQIAGFAFMLPVLTGFMIDWLVVSGRISGKSFISHNVLERGENVISFFTQPLLRLILAGSLLTWSLQYTENISKPTQDNPLILYAMIAFGVLILLGIMGRISALALILLLGWYDSSHLISLIDYIILTATVWILVLGTGRFSLYTWDDDWVNRYDGAK
ncbi:MAG: CDP-alcohol phosphatidyltransferase family protein [Desulfuromusa sp.]|nr:CDP-alcohol phosphatidyltransferase family protein [Desulfuromusa sp.]